jgi:hypothetical protein
VGSGDLDQEELLMARVKVPSTEAVQVAVGPGSVLIRNITATDPVFLEVGAAPADEGGSATIKPAATLAAGYELKTADAPQVISLANGSVLTAIAETAEQELMVLRDGPR